MIEFTDAEGQWYNEYRDLTTDEQGREVFRGFKDRNRSRADYERFEALHTKHEIARAQAIGAEAELRQTKTRQ